MSRRHPPAALTAAVSAVVVVVTLVALPPVDAAPTPPAAVPIERPMAPPPATAPPLPALPPGGLADGSEGPAVLALEQRLVGSHFDPGPIDGEYSGATAHAVMAFEKVMGMEPSGKVDPLVWAALAEARDPEPLLPDGGLRRVEVDLARQLLFLYENGEPVLITHISTGSGSRYCAEGGCGVAVTPAGAHRFMWRIPGWRVSRLGRLYNPVYFTGGGIAIHGAYSVPTHPASHGCVRVPMHIAEWFPGRVKRGDPVYVFDGKTEVRPIGRPTPKAGDAGVEGTSRPSPLEGHLDGQAPARSPARPGDPLGSLA